MLQQEVSKRHTHQHTGKFQKDILNATVGSLKNVWRTQYTTVGTLKKRYTICYSGKFEKRKKKYYTTKRFQYLDTNLQKIISHQPKQLQTSTQCQNLHLDVIYPLQFVLTSSLRSLHSFRELIIYMSFHNS